MSEAANPAEGGEANPECGVGGKEFGLSKHLQGLSPCTGLPASYLLSDEGNTQKHEAIGAELWVVDMLKKYTSTISSSSIFIPRPLDFP